MQTDYTMGLPARIDAYQVDVVRSPLTRNLGARFHDLRDEITASFEDIIPAKSELIPTGIVRHVVIITLISSNRMDESPNAIHRNENCVSNEQPILCRYSFMFVTFSHIST